MARCQLLKFHNCGNHDGVICGLRVQRGNLSKVGQKFCTIIKVSNQLILTEDSTPVPGGGILGELHHVNRIKQPMQIVYLAKGLIALSAVSQRAERK